MTMSMDEMAMSMNYVFMSMKRKNDYVRGLIGNSHGRDGNVHGLNADDLGQDGNFHGIDGNVETQMVVSMGYMAMSMTRGQCPRTSRRWQILWTRRQFLQARWRTWMCLWTEWLCRLTIEGNVQRQDDSVCK